MKILIQFLACLWISPLLGATPAEKMSQAPEWTFAKPVFGQIKLVPSIALAHFSAEKDWDGPWESLDRFKVVIRFSPGRQISPEKFKFVSPTIGIKGTLEGKTESSSRSVSMFRTESSSDNVSVTYERPPDKIELNREYLAATLSSSKAETNWTVLIRLTETVPDYVKATPQKNE